ncbi:MAG: tetratricopeptide repeat protein [bacterium]
MSERKKLGEEEQVLLKKIKDNPVDIKNTYQLGLIYLKQNRLDDAQYIFKELLEMEEDNPSILNTLGLIYNLKNDYQKAEEAFKKALVLNKRSVEIYLNLSQVYVKKELFDKAEKQIRLAINVDSEDPRPYCFMAKLKIRQKRYDEALSGLLKAIEIDIIYTDAYYNLGTLYSIMGQHDKSIEMFFQVLKLDQGNIDAYKALGNLYLHQEEIDKAIEIYEKLQTFMTEVDPEILLKLGESYFKKKDFKRSIDIFKKVLGKDKTSREALYSLGIAYDLINEKEKSRGCFSKLYDLYPGYEGFYLYDIAMDLQNKGRYLAAEERLKEAEQVRPNFFKVCFSLGQNYYILDNYDQALLYFKRAETMVLNIPEIHYYIGCIQKEKGNLNEAIVELEKAIQLKPDFKQAHWSLAIVYEKSERYQEAIKHFKIVTELAPGNKLVQEHLANLESVINNKDIPAKGVVLKKDELLIDKKDRSFVSLSNESSEVPFGLEKKEAEGEEKLDNAIKVKKSPENIVKKEERLKTLEMENEDIQIALTKLKEDNRRLQMNEIELIKELEALKKGGRLGLKTSSDQSGSDESVSKIVIVARSSEEEEKRFKKLEGEKRDLQNSFTKVKDENEYLKAKMEETKKKLEEGKGQIKRQEEIIEGLIVRERELKERFAKGMKEQEEEPSANALQEIGEVLTSKVNIQENQPLEPDTSYKQQVMSNVEVKKLSSEKPINKGKPILVKKDDKKKSYTIQLRAYRTKKEADLYLQRYQKKGYPVYLVSSKTGDWFRLRMGKYESMEIAVDKADNFKQKEQMDYWITFTDDER